MGERRRRIVLVDDSPIGLELSGAALTAAGFEVHGVESVFDVVRTVDTYKPDLIVLDLLMPALGGGKVLEVLRRHASHHCPVLLYSSIAEHELRAHAQACGAEGFLRKSTDTSALVRGVTDQLARGALRGK